MPMTATFRYYPGMMGEEVGSFIWTPKRIAPYIAVGGGFMYYSLSQKGDFVNFQTFDIITGNPKSSGVVPVGHLAAGFDVSINSRFFANFEARYTFAHAHLSEKFTTIREALDLKGLKTTGAIGVRF
jgi:outer membrane protein W